MQCLCDCKLPDHYHQERHLQSETIDDGENLFLNVVYHVLWNNDDTNISIERIRAQHDVINRDFNANNIDLSRVPSTGKYNFASVVGDARITFLPVNSDDLHDIKRTNVTNRSFSGMNDLLAEVPSMSAPDGVLTIFIAPLDGTLLGQAELLSKSCVINCRTVGNAELPGDPLLISYNTGRTATHEIGHVLGLPHTFSSHNTCMSPEINSEFPDIPPQKLPNFDAVLINDNGVWTGTLDNRFRDCNQPVYNIPGVSGPYGCNSDTNCSTGLFEMFFNFNGLRKRYTCDYVQPNPS